MPEAVVLADRIPYYIEVGEGKNKTRAHVHADKGDTVDFDQETYDRLINLDPPVIGTLEDLKAGVRQRITPAAPTDAVAMASMSVAQLVQYIAANPDEEERVSELLASLALDAANALKQEVAATIPQSGSAITDEEIRKLSRDDAITWLNGHPDIGGEILQRFIDLENERDHPRTSLLEYLDKRQQALAAL